MIALNITIEDKLVNGLAGTVMKFKNGNNSVKIVFVKCDREAASRAKIIPDRFALEHRWVPIEKRKASFGTSIICNKPQ